MLFPSPAHAEPVRTVYIVPADFPVADYGKLQRTIDIWNYNTTTRLVMTEMCDIGTQCAILTLSDLPDTLLGQASPWEGFIELNRQWWNQITGIKGGWRAKRQLLCHEVGHILGVGHTEVGCMHAIGHDSRFPGAYNRSIVPAELGFDWVV